MPFSVTSWFVEQAQLKRPTVTRKFTLGGSDYTGWVMRWPTISRGWNDLRPTSVTIGLDNAEQTFNFLRDDKSLMENSAVLQIGFTHPTSGDELITPFTGTIDKMAFRGAAVDLTLIDKVRKLSERLVGTSSLTVVMSSSTLLPSDIAWNLVTSYGGFSSVASTSNTDVDYQSWLDWAAVWSGDSVYMGARFDGKSVLAALRSLGRMTDSAIFMKENRLAFYRFTTINTLSVALDEDAILGASISVDGENIVNRQYVYADYRVESDYYAITCFDTKSASVNSFGLRTRLEKDESVWYVNSVSALNLAQRRLNIAGVPFDEISVNAPLVPVHQLIGEAVDITHALLGISGGYRIMKSAINLGNGTVKFDVDASQTNTPFLLDLSSLDGPDLLL